MFIKFQKAINNNYGIKFTITKEEDKLEWSSLVDPDKLKVLNKLPEAFQNGNINHQTYQKWLTDCGRYV